MDHPGVAAYMAAMKLMEQRQLEKGAAALQSILDSSRDDGFPARLLPDVHSNLGTALSNMNRHDQAMTSLQAAVDAAPDNALYRYNFGYSLAELGRGGEAEEQYRICVGLPGASAFSISSCYNNLGNLFVNSGRRPEALECFRAVTELTPRNPAGLNNYGNILRDKSDEASLFAAGRSYAAAIRLKPTYLEAYKNLGNMLKERPEWHDSAIRAYRTALALVPVENVEASRQLLLNMGDVLQWTGRLGAANATFALGVARGVWQHAEQRPSHFVAGLRGLPWWTHEQANRRVVRKLLSPSGLSTLRTEGMALLGARMGAGGSAGGGSAGGGEGGGGGGKFQRYYSPALASGEWSDVTLVLSGVRQFGASLAPRSYALYESLGEDATTMVMGSAYFSVLTPGSRLKAHCGPTNIRLRVHVGLLVREGAALRVGQETRPWLEDDALIFDDSFEHEVWNESNETRLVFIVDIWHPQLKTDAERSHALDKVGRQRYELATRSLRSGYGLPATENTDLLAERRVRTIF